MAEACSCDPWRLLIEEGRERDERWRARSRVPETVGGVRAGKRVCERLRLGPCGVVDVGREDSAMRTGLVVRLERIGAPRCPTWSAEGRGERWEKLPIGGVHLLVTKRERAFFVEQIREGES